MPGAGKYARKLLAACAFDRSKAARFAVRDKDDKALFNDVFLPYLPEAFRLARSLTGSTNDAEDVVQEAAIRAFRGINTFGAVNARAWSSDDRPQHGL